MLDVHLIRHLSVEMVNGGVFFMLSPENLATNVHFSPLASVEVAPVEV